MVKTAARERLTKMEKAEQKKAAQVKKDFDEMADGLKPGEDPSTIMEDPKWVKIDGVTLEKRD
jgi:hypothetical protein